MPDLATLKRHKANILQMLLDPNVDIPETANNSPLGPQLTTKLHCVMDLRTRMAQIGDCR